MFRRADGWESISSEEFLRRIAGLSSAFVELGVKTGDRVAIFSANRPEWHTADFAITGAGGVSVPIYFNESPQRMTYILNHSEARIVFVSGVTQLQKLLGCRAALNSVEHIVAADAGAGLAAGVPAVRNAHRGRRRRGHFFLPTAHFAGIDHATLFADLHLGDDRRAQGRNVDA